MASYIARVELHSANYTDYETLHSAMERQGYSRKIVSSDGARYALPTGTYDIASSSLTLAQALECAKSAAAETGKKHSIVVAERTGATWNGLVKL